MGINGVSSYANTYTYGNVKNENVKPSKNSEKNYYAGYTMNSANGKLICRVPVMLLPENVWRQKMIVQT